MTPEEMKQRTRAAGVGSLSLVERLPRSRGADVAARQLARCATSVGANYRAACRAKSPADFLFKLKIVEEEADEAIYWLELIAEMGHAAEEDVQSLVREMGEIVAIVVASIRTTRCREERRAEGGGAGHSLSSIGNPKSRTQP